MTDALTAVALGAIKATAEQRDEVKPGEHEIDALVRVRGTLNVGKDHDAKVVASVPWMRLAAVLLDKLNGVTVESVLREALDEGLDTADLKAAAEAAMQTLATSTTKTRKGAVKAKLTAEVVEDAEAEGLRIVA